MTAELIKGLEIAKKKRDELKEQTAQLKEQGVTPGLAVILVGDDPASHSYVKGKQKGDKHCRQAKGCKRSPFLQLH